jgi:muramoyltetrapeptide carboxypeptidase
MLRKGDLVRLVSPASYPTQDLIDQNIETLRSWGLRCDTGKHILDQRGYMAGTDANRLNDINTAFRDPEVRAIIATRGGAGAYRISDDIDFAAVRNDPKPLVGFSDITSMHLALYNNCQLGSIHGCLFGNTAKASEKMRLMSTEPITLNRDANAVSATIQIPGRAQGRLLGGNLQMVATSIGVNLPSLDGAILFLEYHRKGLGTIDRYLTQLLRSNRLKGIVGVALGSFEACRDYCDRGWTVTDVLGDRLQELNVPLLGGLNAGHDLTDRNGGLDQSNLPLGSLATLDADNGSITIESVVC